ncbi:MAG: leucine--tRNA ligase [Candidatus Aenigmatarchaeota archaeon]
MDFKKIEKKWQVKWEKAKIFEANVNPKKEKYFFTVPYPYASGPAHVGHGRTYTLGDVTARFLRMKGFNLLWPLAWHITGTPVLAISKRIGNGERNIIEEHKEYVSLHKPEDAEKIVKTFVKPENVANFYASVWINDIKELGCSVDWRRQFTTGEDVYNQFIKWQYHHLNSLGYLVKGTHPVFYCPSDDNPVTTDDVKGGDTLEMTIGEFYLIKMRFEDGYFVVATLRPETIYGTTNAWVNPNSTCVKAEVDGEVWYISKSASEKLRNQGHKVKIISEFSGTKLLNKEIEVPFANEKVPILPASFVDEDVGTGVVFSVPAHAPLDLIALKDLEGEHKIRKISPIGVIKIDGFSDIPAEDMLKKFKINSQNETEKLEKATHELYSHEFYNGLMKENSKELAGLRVQGTKEKIYQLLLARKLGGKMYDSQVKDGDGKLVKDIFCRDGTKVIVKVIEQWFLDYGNEKWKAIARNALSKMSIVPELYRKSFESSIGWLHEWPCARTRGLGTKLPYDQKWVIESLSDSTIYMAFYTIAHHIRKNEIKPQQLTKELFDFIFSGKGNLKQIARGTKIKEPVIKQMRGEFKYWYPLDERRTAIMHIPNHLTFFIFHHAALFPENLWPRKVSLNEALLSEGKKMSKSLGNVIPLVEAIREHGADVIRLFLTSANDASSTLDWREKDVESLKGKLERFYEIINSAKAGISHR